MNNITEPSLIQVESYGKITNPESNSLIIGSETGSGKTLFYLLPLFDDILTSKETNDLHYEYCRAIILVPNKELAQQVLRMSIDICGGVSPDSQEDGHGVRVALIPGGLSSPYDYKLFRESIYKNSPMVDIAITTPNSISKWGMSTRYIDFFSNVPTLVIDEADMLLDGGYIQGLNNILIGFNRADRIIRKQQMESLTAEQTAEQTTQYIFVAATLPNSGLKSCYAYLNKKFPKSEKVIMKNFHNACHTGLEESEPT